MERQEAVRRPGKWRRWRQEEEEESEKEDLVEEEENEGRVLWFRFPQAAPSGGFTL